jgi:polysaccharide export outer membrane protein
MKTHTFVTTLLAMAVAICTLAPVSAKGKDDKKTATATPGIPDEYRMGAGDKLRIEVYKDPQLSQSAQVRPDGKVTLPLIGDLMASGLTPIELRDLIATKLKEYVTNPTVTVIVVETVPATAYVMGEVNHPGAVNLQTPLTIIQALAIAGGLKDFADEKNIRVLRMGSAGVKTITFNYRDAMKSNGAPIYLQRGDTVVVPD